MSEHDENFDETLRSIAEELGRSVERVLERFDVEEIAETIGVDPDRAREWADSAGGWLRAQAENLGEELAQRTGGLTPFGGPPAAPRHQPAPGPAPDAGQDPLKRAAPHPLDVPTDDQGLALSALDSGRWSLEPGSDALMAKGEGAGPSDALGLVRELRARDWIAPDGQLTLAGRHALRRWLDAADTGR